MQRMHSQVWEELEAKKAEYLEWIRLEWIRFEWIRFGRFHY